MPTATSMRRQAQAGTRRHRQAQAGTGRHKQAQAGTGRSTGRHRQEHREPQTPSVMHSQVPLRQSVSRTRLKQASATHATLETGNH